MGRKKAAVRYLIKEKAHFLDNRFYQPGEVTEPFAGEPTEWMEVVGDEVVVGDAGEGSA